MNLCVLLLDLLKYIALVMWRVPYKKLIFFFSTKTYVVGTQKEPSQWDGSFEHPQNLLKIRGKKTFTIVRWKLLFILTCVWALTSLYEWSSVNHDLLDSKVKFGTKCIIDL